MGAGLKLRPDSDLAASLFERLTRDTADPPGITRPAYGPGAEKAHRMAAACGAALGLDITCDFAGKTYLTLPGRDRAAMTGDAQSPIRFVIFGSRVINP